MTPEEKILNLIELSLIEKHGEDFLELSEEDKYELIYQTTVECFEQLTK